MNWIKGIIKRDHRVVLSEVLKKEEISLNEIFIFFWERRRLPILLGILLMLLGILNTRTIPEIYEANTVIIPEGKSQNTSLIQGSGLTSLLGIGNTNPASGSADITSPAMFPTLINSNDFMLDLLQKEVYSTRYKDKYALQSYLLTHDSRTFIQKVSGVVRAAPQKVMNLFSGNKSRGDIAEQDTLYRITSQKIAAIEELKELITIESNGALTSIRTKCYEPEMSVVLNHIILDELIEAVADLRTSKERKDLMYLEIQTDSARENFEQAQTRLARFRDANRGMISALARTEEERLSADYQVKFNIYNSLAVKLESQKTTLQENTPVFTIFERAYVPAKPQTSSYLKTILIYFVFGTFIGYAGVFLREILSLQNG